MMDDFTNYLLPLQPEDSLLFSFSPIPTINHPYLEYPATHHDQDLEINQYHVASSSLSIEADQGIHVINNNNTHTVGERRRKRASRVGTDQNHVKGKNPEHKRASHRDVERQRRQEMANLYASLRNLLPLEYIKGKRSISDHVLEAENYIKHMEKKIRELEAKRDKLIRSSRAEKSIITNLENKNVEEITNSLSNITLTMDPCKGGGLEILMKNYLTSDTNWFPLSRILDVLVEEGLAVLSCVCTKVNEGIIYTIQTHEASHITDADLIYLQENLAGKFMTWKNLSTRS